MLASLLLNDLRQLLNDPSGSPTFSDARLLNFIDIAQGQAVRDTSSPESYQVFSTQTVITLAGTPTTGENFTVQVGGTQVPTAETTGQSLAQLATAVQNTVNASSVNALVSAVATSNTIAFTCLGTGFTGNTASVSILQGVHVQGTVAWQQEYQIYEQLRTEAVYVAGKLITPSTPAIMEGWNYGIWDQNRLGTTPAPGSGAVPGTVGEGAPSWINAPPIVYPTQTGFENSIKPTVQPYSNIYSNNLGIIQPERYYWRAPGTIGFVPQPTNLCQVVIYGVCMPPTITSSGQQMLVPDSYRQWIVAHALWLARLSENTTNPGQQTLIDNAFQWAMREGAACRVKARNAKGKEPRTFQHIPSRTLRTRYHVQRNGGGRWR